MKYNYLKLPRDIVYTCEFYKDSKAFNLYLCLLLEANQEEHTQHNIVVKPGQVITNNLQLATSSGIAPNTIQRILNKLTKLNYITIEKVVRNKYKLITITNYNQYIEES